MTASVSSASRSVPVNPHNFNRDVQDKLALIADKFAAYKAIPNTDIIEQKQLNRAAQFDLLHEAYALCLSLQNPVNSIEVRHAAYTQQAMILGEFGIMFYGSEPRNYPAIKNPSKAEFTLSQQILLTALQSFLTRLYSFGEWDFKEILTNDLKDMPNRIWTDGSPKLFDFVKDGFCTTDIQVLLAKTADCNFTKEEKLHLSKMLRYVNGSTRFIRAGNLAALHADPNKTILQKITEANLIDEKDKPLTIRTLYLAKHLSKDIPNEYWEVMYNDWADVYKAEGSWSEEKKVELREWLVSESTFDSQLARTLNKFFEPKLALAKCMEIIQRSMDPEDFIKLQAITKGEILDQEKIDAVASTLRGLDLSQKGTITIGNWFVLIPHNVAKVLLQDSTSNRNEIEGLLRLAVALSKPQILAGDVHVNLKTVIETWVKFITPVYVQKAMTFNKEAMEAVNIVSKNTINVSEDQINIEENLALLEKAETNGRRALEQLDEAKAQMIAGDTSQFEQMIELMRMPTTLMLEKVSALKNMLNLLKAK